MDYETKPTSRNDLRRYSAYFRKLFDVPETGPFPVLEALDKVNDVFDDCGYVIVEEKNCHHKLWRNVYRTKQADLQLK